MTFAFDAHGVSVLTLATPAPHHHLGAVLLAGMVWTMDRVGVDASTRVRVARAALLGACVPWGTLEAPAWAPPLPGVAPEALGGVAAPVVATVAAARAALPAAIPWTLLGAALVAVGIARLAVHVVAAGRLVRRTRTVRRFGGVAVRVGDVPGPCSLWTPFGAMILLDHATWSRPADRALAMRHEARHLRHGDGAWAWLWAAADALLCGNPAMAWLGRHLRHAEELAVDRALVDAGVPAAPYADLLLRTATHGQVGHRLVPALSRPPLHERIAMLRAPSRLRLPLLAALLLGQVPVLATALAGDASRGAVTDGLANEPAIVRERLDHITRSPKGRAWMQRGLTHFTEVGPLIDYAIEHHGLPRWVAAVPVLESACENLGPEANPVHAAGMWQFIPDTARAMGLRVDDSADDRLDPVLATDAALRLLRQLHAEFGDWGLALSAYNVGASAVREAIALGGTRDPWALIEAGHLPTYAADVAATAIIMRNPHLVDGR